MYRGAGWGQGPGGGSDAGIFLLVARTPVQKQASRQASQVRLGGRRARSARGRGGTRTWLLVTAILVIGAARAPDRCRAPPSRPATR
jgi:hypothetical protein